MLPSLVTEIPKGEEWGYEVKYDGFRAMIYVEAGETTIVSRNLNILNEQFPEIIEAFRHLTPTLKHPLILDGELCVLDSELKANFEKIQHRGRLKNKEKIDQAKKLNPVIFLAFDLVMEDGNSLVKTPFLKRKRRLELLVEKRQNPQFLKYVPFNEDSTKLWKMVSDANGEGLIAKRKDSLWEEGQRSRQWLKIKNMMIASFFILAYDDANAFFHIGCIYKGGTKLIGKVGQGFTKEEKEALTTIVKKNKVKTENSLTYVNPSICIEVEFLEISKNELRHPKFRRFRFDKSWEECTWEAIPKGELN
nr:non-homologous end-joining DNA ligase [Anaerobacillus isosaccharinicus]